MDRLQWNDFGGNAAAIKNARGLRFFPRRTIVLLAAILFAHSGIGFAQKKQKLDKNFRDWLERDVAYIITKDERDAFLKLTTDEAREKFIETFWEIPRQALPPTPTKMSFTSASPLPMRDSESVLAWKAGAPTAAGPTLHLALRNKNRCSVTPPTSTPLKSGFTAAPIPRFLRFSM